MNALVPVDPSHIVFSIKLFTGIPPIWIDNVTLQEGEMGAYQRDFEHGTAIVNPTGITKTINLNQIYYHINGTQDPAVNNGQATTSVTVPSNDGVILLTAPTPTGTGN